jgi:hypothetical protein
MPTHEQITKALRWFVDLNPRELPEIFFGQILAAAYIEEKEEHKYAQQAGTIWATSALEYKARAELVERQYSELRQIYETPLHWNLMLARHEAERKALTSQTIDKASKPDA